MKWNIYLQDKIHKSSTEYFNLILGGVVYVSYLAFCPEARKGCRAKPSTCNQKIRKGEAKVVDMIDIEDIAEKAAFCRWWVKMVIQLLSNSQILQLSFGS